MSDLCQDWAPQDDPSLAKIKKLGDEAKTEKGKRFQDFQLREAQLTDEIRGLKTELTELRESKISNWTDDNKRAQQQQQQLFITKMENGLDSPRKFKENAQQVSASGSAAPMQQTQRQCLSSGTHQPSRFPRFISKVSCRCFVSDSRLAIAFLN